MARINLNSKIMQEIRREAKQYNVPILHEKKAQWLLDLVQEIQPTRVLELGTATGYSGIILGSTGAYVTTIELSCVELARARKNFKKLGTNVTMIYGDALEQIKKVEGEFDLIFVDFTNRHYVDVLEDCIRVCKKGGLIIADNIHHEKSSPFKDKILNDKRLETQIVDIGDGVSKSIMI